MKKKLEAELISIAHRILKMKNKDDVHQLHLEAQKLYEKLSVLVFVEDNFDTIKPTIGLNDLEEKLDFAYGKNIENELLQEKVVEIEQEQKKEDIVIESSKIETTLDESDDKKEKNIETIAEIKLDSKQISIDDLLSQVVPEPIFEKVSEINIDKIPSEINKIIEEKVEESKTEAPINIETENNEFVPEFKEITFEKVTDEKPITNLNDKMGKTSGLTLNDRVAFEKNLFDGSTEDLNRVISQLATFDTFEDAKNFIDEMVKPDYNDWQGKDEFASRFMDFVESKFV